MKIRCLICKISILPLKENKYFPFCSNQCKMVDLYNWLDEQYTNLDEPPVKIEDEDKSN